MKPLFLLRTRATAAAVAAGGLAFLCAPSVLRAEPEAPGVSTPAVAGAAITDPRARAVEEALAAGRVTDARRQARKMVKADKRSPQAWTLLGRVALADNKPRRALSYFARSLKLDPHNAAAFFGRGQASEKRNRLDEAANEYRAAALADPRFTAAQEALQRLKDIASLPE